jgi:RNA polymerase sigma factor (TIGR02999 family)
VESSIVSIADAVGQGEKASAESLFGILYAELHRLARRELARRGGYVSVSPTTLIHEAYLNMAGPQGPLFPDRGRFMAYAGRVMRGLIVDHARNGQAQKRGGGFEITQLGNEVSDEAVDSTQLARISEALDELAKIEPSLVEVVDLKFFCGFSFGEIAALQNVSERTVQRKWNKARIFLYSSMQALSI